MFREVAGSQTIASNAAAQGVDLAPLREGAALTAQAWTGRQRVTGDGHRLGLVFAVLFLLSAMGYGMQIAQSVVEEKQSRIVEILTAAIPVQPSAGKVIGELDHRPRAAAAVPRHLFGRDGLHALWGRVADAGSGIGWFVVFFVAGFASLACIWAAAGALATRQDLSETAMPLMMVMLGAYFAGFLATGAWRVGLSYVPIAEHPDALACSSRGGAVVGSSAGAGPHAGLLRGCRAGRRADVPPWSPADGRR